MSLPSILVSIFSASRKGYGNTLYVQPGGFLTVTYVINTLDFRVLEINFNGSLNSIFVAPHKMNTRKVKDPRLSFVDVSQKDKSTGIRIRLDNLTLKDNGLSFTYTYVNKYLKKRRGENPLVVRMGTEQNKNVKEQEKSVTNTLVITCIVLVAVLVLITTVVHLVKRGIVQLNICGPRGNSDGGSVDTHISSSNKMINEGENTTLHKSTIEECATFNSSPRNWIKN